jgi:hypothetical protein
MDDGRVRQLWPGTPPVLFPTVVSLFEVLGVPVVVLVLVVGCGRKRGSSLEVGVRVP